MLTDENKETEPAVFASFRQAATSFYVPLDGSDTHSGSCHQFVGDRPLQCPDVRPSRSILSRPAIDGFFAIMDKLQIPIERTGELLGGMPRSTVYKLKSAAGTLRQDELTRTSY